MAIRYKLFVCTKNIIQDLLSIREQSQTCKVSSAGAKIFAPAEGLSPNAFAPSGRMRALSYSGRCPGLSAYWAFSPLLEHLLTTGWWCDKTRPEPAVTDRKESQGAKVFVQNAWFQTLLLFCPISSLVLPNLVSCFVQTRLLFCPISFPVLLTYRLNSLFQFLITSRFTPPFFFMLPTFIARSSHVHYSFSARCALVKVWSRTSAERVMDVRSVKAHAILIFPKRISYLAQTHLWFP